MSLKIIKTEETLFFSHVDGVRTSSPLSQWIEVTIENRDGRPVQAYASIRAAGEESITPLEIAPGVGIYRAYAPALWPDHPPEPEAVLTLTFEDKAVSSPVPVGHHRPWTVYLLSDACVDYVWAYESEAAMRRDDAALLEAELAAADATLNAPLADRNHYNLVHVREIEYFLEYFPAHEQRLMEHFRRGTLTLNPVLNMCLTAGMSLEELVRQFYPARNLARKAGLNRDGGKAYRYANLQETPTAAWATPSILAGSGVDRLVRSILPYECPWAKRLENPLIYWWEGPDGSRVLVRQRNEDYVEGSFVLKGPEAANVFLREKLLPLYESRGDDYPFDVIGLVGLYGDLAYQTRGLPAVKTAAVADYNRQGWEYPKLVNASHQQFWEAVRTSSPDAQMEERKIEIPVLRGDFGSSWDSWPACLAVSFASWRQAQERAGTADKLAAILNQLEPGWSGARGAALGEGWQNLLYLADHAWNGATPGNRQVNADLRRAWRNKANQSFETILEDGLPALARRIPTGEAGGALVFNGLGWERSALARLPVRAGEDLPSLLDPATSLPLPVQAVEENGEKSLYFIAEEIPSIGYRVYPAGPPNASPSSGEQRLQVKGTRLEGPFYALEIDPLCGGVRSLFDRRRGRELVDPGSPYRLNEAVYLTAGENPSPPPGSYHLYQGVNLEGMEERRARLVSVEPGSCGPVFAELRVHSAIGDIQFHTTYRLYAALDRLDIANEVEKPVSAEKQELDFVFPFLIPGCQARYETPGAIVQPGAEQRPGAGLAWTTVRHFVDLFTDEIGVTFSMADSGLVEFGHRTTGEDPQALDLSNGTLLAVALENCMDWNESIHDQHGETRFFFRYSLRGHAGGFDPGAAVRFGWEDNNELMAVLLPARQPGDLSTESHSFLSVSPQNVILTTLKIAEEQGLAARLWECAGQDTLAKLHAGGLGELRGARRTDLLEEDLEDLPTEGGETSVAVRGRGLATVRLLF